MGGGIIESYFVCVGRGGGGCRGCKKIIMSGGGGGALPDVLWVTGQDSAAWVILNQSVGYTPLSSADK